MAGAVQPRKALAMSGRNDFGVGPIDKVSGTHELAGKGGSVRALAMQDKDRAAGRPVRHSKGRGQAAPDHGLPK